MTPEGVTIRHPDKLFIGGEWVAPLSGGEIEIVNPNSEEVVARVAGAGEADMDRAVAAARQAFDHGPWPTTPPAARGAKLMEMVDYLETRVPELCAAATARSMSSGPASATRATTSSLLGLTISMWLPLVGATHSPPMNSLSGCRMVTPSGVIGSLRLVGRLSPRSWTKS